MERKSFKFESKVNLDKNTFEGYAAAFNNIDSHNDIIEPGAFSKTLKESFNRIKVLWQHDPMSPIGIPVEMHEDSKGLYVRSKISETSLGKDALILMKDKVINELSIGYNTVKHFTDEDTGVRHLKELKLLEFSPVTWASNDQAIITDAKYSQNILTMLSGIKAGKVLSKKNEKLVKEAINALNALLESNEPDKSTHEDSESHIESNESDYHSLLKEMEEFKKQLGGM